MLKKIDDFFIRVQKHIGGVLFCAIFFFCLAQVACRYVLHISSPWTEELARVGMVYMTFFAAAYGIRMNTHPSVDFLVKKFPLRARMILAVIMELLIIGVGLILVIYGWKYVERTASDLSTTYHYPKSVWYIPIPVSGVIMVIYSVRNICLYLMSFAGNRDLTFGGMKQTGGEET